MLHTPRTHNARIINIRTFDFITHKLLADTKMLQRIILFVVTFATVVLMAYGKCPFVSVEYNEPIEILESQYCFVNECTIRIKHSNLLLSIISNYTDEDWIIVANATKMFTAPANSINCISNSHEIDSFVFLSISDSIIIISSGINVLVHIFIKELHNVMGAIVIALCASVNISYVLQLTTALFQYVYPVHGSTWVCATLKYGVALFLLMYEVLKLMYLCHFGYLMYRSYKLKPTGPNNALLCRTYAITTIVVTTLPMVIVVAVGLTGDRDALATTPDGYCNNFFHQFETFRKKAFLLVVGVMTILQVVVFVIAITLYLFVTKSCCGKGLNDARVSIILISTIGLSIVILIILLAVGVKGVSSVIAANTATCVEQITLLIICLTHKKVKKRLWKIFYKSRNTYSFTN